MKLSESLIHHCSFSGKQDFLSSLNPAARYYNMESFFGVSITGGAIAKCIEMVFGMEWLALIGFVVLLGIELVTGIWASRMRGERTESGKLKRFGLLLGVWLVILVLLFVLNVLAKYSGSEIAEIAVGFMRNGFLIWMIGQYLVSVLENLSVITGKSNHVFIAAIRKKILAILGITDENN